MTAISRRESQRATSGAVHALAFQPRGRLCAFADVAGEILFVDTRDGTPTLRIVSGGAGQKCFVVFSSDGRLVAYPAEAGRQVHVLELASRRTVARLQPADGGITAVAFVNDDHQLLIASRHSLLTRWDLASGTQLASASTNQNDLFSIIPLIRRGLIATACTKGIQLRDAQSLVTKEVLPPFVDKLHSQAVASPDESMLLSGSVTGKVVTWDLNAGGRRIDLVGHEGLVEGVAFCPDGTTFATCGGDDALRLWDVRTLQEIGRFNFRTYAGSRSSPLAVGFSPDAASLAVGGQRADWGAIHCWSIGSDGHEGAASLLNKPYADFATYDCLVDRHVERRFEATNDVILEPRAAIGPSLRIPDGHLAHFNSLVVGGGTGTAELAIGNGSTVNVSDDLFIGRYAGSRGQVIAPDHAVWRSNHPFVIGDYGQGEFLVRGGSTIESQLVVAGAEPPGVGTVTVDGTGSAWHTSGRFLIGDRGRGRLTITGGATVMVDEETVLAHKEGSRAAVTISGPSSSLRTSGLDIGARSRGTVGILAGGSLVCDEAALGRYSGGDSVATIDGEGSSFICSGALFVAGDASRSSGSPGRVVIKAGARVTTRGVLKIWHHGIVSVDGGTLEINSLDLADTGTIVYRSGEISIAGEACLNGRLDVTRCDAVSAAAGGRIQVMTYDKRSGEFTSIKAPSGLIVTPDYGTNGLVLAVTRQVQP